MCLKRGSLGLGILFFVSAVWASHVRLDTDWMRLRIDEKGCLTELYDKEAKQDYLCSTRPSYLIQLKRYSEENLKPPTEMKLLSKSENSVLMQVRFDHKTSLTILMGWTKGWLHFEIKDAKGVEDIDAIRWGPYSTTLVDGVGGFFGILYSPTATLGLSTLDPNTDGECIQPNGVVRLTPEYSACAKWLPWPEKGSQLLLDSIDHTHPRSMGLLRTSSTIPKGTVVGSKVALWMVPKGRELDLLEKMIQTEKLPFCTVNGIWAKRSKEILAPSIWSWFDENTVDRTIRFCEDVSGELICPFAHMFGNWGHFDPDPKVYPGGWEALRKISAQCAKKGIRTTMYTLTNFLKPITQPEPFITPKVDPRFARYDAEVELSKSLNSSNTLLRLELSEALRPLLEGKDSEKTKAVALIDDELVWFSNAVFSAHAIELQGCKRGYLLTKPKFHRRKTAVRFLYYAGYKNLFPGTFGMNREVATIIGKRAQEGAFTKVTLDGHESCLQTGLGYLAMNDTMRTIWKLNADREMLYTGSRLTAYTWYMLSYISWGEFDKFKGFRGSMLDYRLRRQIQHERNLMPHKLGQHYPDDATLEDIHWLMSQAVGWNAGVEFDVRPDNFNRKPEADAIKKAVRLWEKARLSGKITESQKLALEQIDRVYEIQPEEKAPGWSIHLLKKRWVDPRCKILDPSVIKLKNLIGEFAAQPTQIDLSWTHNPLIYTAAAISDDIPLKADELNKWQVEYPEAGANAGDVNGNQFKFVLRVPPDAPCGIRNPLFSISNTQHFMVPVELKPGEYLATPFNAPIVFVYNQKHEVMARIPIRYTNDLPNMHHRPHFFVECTFESLQKNKTPTALLNLFYSEILHGETY